MRVKERNVYRSRITALRVNVLKGREIRHPVTGDIIERVPAVVAEFGLAGPEYQQVNQLTGEMDTFAQIIGGLYDLDAVADQKIRDGLWTKDIRDAVKRRLDAMSHERPDLVEKVDYLVAPAPKPWATYDDLAPDRIPELAQELGLLGVALAYERENEDRQELVAELSRLLGVHADPEPEPEPVVAEKPAKVVESGGGRVVV